MDGHVAGHMFPIRTYRHLKLGEMYLTMIKSRHKIQLLNYYAIRGLFDSLELPFSRKNTYRFC